MSEFYKLRESDDYKVYYINHANTKVGGSVDVDENGFASIYINSRRSTDQQRKTLNHELRHLVNGDLDNDAPIEIVEARAAAKEIIPEKPTEPVEEQGSIWDEIDHVYLVPSYPVSAGKLPLSKTLRADAAVAFAFSEDDPQWPEIIWAMLVTGCNLSKDDPLGWTDFYFRGVRVRKGMLYYSRIWPGTVYVLKRRRLLGYRHVRETTS